MGMVTTPEGIPMWVPDELSALQGLQGMTPTPPAAPQFEAPPPEADAHVPPSVTGGKLPTQDSQQAPAGPPAQTSPDVPVAKVDTSPATIDKTNKTADKQAAQQAAYQASPEGQIASATQGQQQAEQEKAGLARVQGSVEAQQAGDVAKIEQQGQQQAGKLYADLQASQAARAAGLQEHQKQIATAVDTEAKYKVDDNRKYANMSTGKKIAYWIMAGLSGLGDALMKKTGPNMVIGMMQQAIQDDVAAQVRERDELGKRIGYARSSLDTYDKITGSDIESKQLLLAENYKRVADQVRASAAKYGGDLAKIRGEQIAAQFEEAADQIKGSAGQSSFDRIYRQQQMAMEKQRVAQGWAAQKLQRDQFTYTKERDQKELTLRAAELDQKGQAAQAAQVAEHGVGGMTTAQLDADGNPVMDKDGNPILKQDVIVAPFAGKEALAKLQDKKAATDEILGLIDDTLRLRAEHGWESDFGKSDAWRQMKANWGALKSRKKDLMGLGALSEADYKLLDETLGASDPTSIRDPSAGLQQARKNTLLSFNSSIQAAGSTQTYNPPQVGLTPPAETGEDVAFKQTLKSPGVVDLQRQNIAAQKIQPGQPGYDPEAVVGARNATQTGIPKAVIDEVAGYENTINDPNASAAAKRAAGARLLQGSQTSDSQALKDYFAAALQRTSEQAVGRNAKVSPEEVR